WGQRPSEEAGRLYRQALELRGRVCGTDPPDYAASMNNLADVYRETGRDAEAEPLYCQSLAVCERALGDNHPNTAVALHNLAGLYHRHADLAAAEPPSLPAP